MFGVVYQWRSLCEQTTHCYSQWRRSKRVILPVGNLMPRQLLVFHLYVLFNDNERVTTDGLTEIPEQIEFI